MTERLYLLTVCLPLATILIVFGMRSYAAVQQARARLANDEAYRQIAQAAVTAQSETATVLASIQAGLAEAATRLAAVEKILKDVE